jgi:protocatechuate 3,4-dioxygenase beta subunit
LTTYYPGTPDEAAAQRVRTRIGTETPGIEIRLVQGRLFRISGAVTDSQGRPMARGSGQLARRAPSMGGFSSGFSTDEQGRFQMRNIPPGNYRLIIRMNRPEGPTAPGTDPPEMANVPLTVAGADLDNVYVMTTPGTTITGQVVFEQGPPSTIPGQIRVMAMIGNQDDMMGISTPQPVVVTPELTFTMKGLMGELLLRASAQGQYVRSVTVSGEDITDTPREFKTNDRVTITFTSRVSTVEGNVTDAKGVASTDASIILFSEEKASWRTNSTRTRRAGVDANGNFRLPGLMPGRYFIAAVPRDRLNGPTDAAFLELLSKEATSLVLGDDEQRRVDLKVLESAGGQ